ncbi:MAG: NADH-quinone oxidoreductase subunit H, partial [Chitinivibrionales bacterium]|nr:NADH-quinone oxidoreductase subunit H [Chitinivibrionales bacterium]
MAPLNLHALLAVSLGLCGAPLMLGIITKVKAFFAGRNGPPLVQPYYDIVKLLRKGAVYSRTTTWVFKAGPIVCLAGLLGALCILPLGRLGAPLSFKGDILVFVYLLGLARFFTVVAALDTGSAFEGMGASREVFFSALAEPVLLLCLFALCKDARSLDFSGILGG